MSSYSIRLAAVGAMIGALTLSAAAYANLSALRDGGRAAAEATAPAGSAVRYSDSGGPAGDPDAAPVWAAQRAGPLEEPESGPGQTETEQAAEAARPLWYAALCQTEPQRRTIQLCDAQGGLCAEVRTDAAGNAALGPIPPGRYLLRAGAEALGSFRLLDNAALTEADGRLWTDGELLHLETFRPGQADFRLRLPRPGYYSFALVDDFGRRWTQDLFLPADAEPDADGVYSRLLSFRGLRAGRYTFVYARDPLLQVRVCAGATILTAVKIELKTEN